MESKINYKNKHKGYLRCNSCQTLPDDNSHVLYCEVYRDLRSGKNLQCDRDLGQYLQNVLLIQTKLKLNQWSWSLSTVTTYKISSLCFSTRPIAEFRNNKQAGVSCM